jgi:putative peptidoglycan lipid II flippase
MIAGTLAVSSQAFLLAEPVFKIQGYRYRPFLIIKEMDLVRLNMSLIPIMIGVGINSLNLAVDNAIGSFLIEGTIAELSYADGVMDFFANAVLMALVTAIFPVISEKMRHGNFEEGVQSIAFSIRIVTLVAIPATVLTAFLAKPLVRLFYERGQFGTEATLSTANMLIWYGAGIAGMALSLLVARIFYASEDNLTPLKIGIVALIFNIILDLILIRFMGPPGLALGTSLAVTISAIYGIRKLDQLYGFLRLKELWVKSMKIVMAGVVMSSAVFVILDRFETVASNSFIGNAALIIAASITGMMAFTAIVFVTRA